MRIFTKRAFKFNHPSGSDENRPVYVRDQTFSDVPDWVADSATFKLAIKDPNELISVIESKKDEVAAETGKGSKKKKDPQNNQEGQQEQEQGPDQPQEDK